MYLDDLLEKKKWGAVSFSSMDAIYLFTVKAILKGVIKSNWNLDERNTSKLSIKYFDWLIFMACQLVLGYFIQATVS